MGALHELVECLHGYRLLVARGGGDRHDLLGEHVECVAWNDRGLDLPLAHPLSDDRALEQIGAELGEDPATADRVDRVPGAADSLQPAGD